MKDEGFIVINLILINTRCKLFQVLNVQDEFKPNPAKINNRKLSSDGQTHVTDYLYVNWEHLYYYITNTDKRLSTTGNIFKSV